MKTARHGIDIAQASRSRRALAGLIDVAIFGALTRRVLSHGDRERLRLLSSIASPEALREQLRTPGQRIAGLRTVDRRTGERVALWRSLVLAGASGCGALAMRRVQPSPPTSEQERERERALVEMESLYRRHPIDREAREAERARLATQARSPVDFDVKRVLATTLAVALLRAALRRRLAPTIEVDARRS